MVITAAGIENNPEFHVALPGSTEETLVEGTDWRAIIEYAINEYLEKEWRESNNDAI